MATDPGKLRYRVQIQALTEARNSSVPGMDQSYATAVTRWADIETLSARELWQAQAAQSDATHTVTIRYYSSVTTKHRILYGTRYFEILGVVHDRQTWTRLTCKEVSI